MEKIVKEVRQVLQEASDEHTLSLSNHFFKKGDRALVWGVRMPTVSKIAKTYYQEVKGLPKADIFVLCEAMWQSGYLEEAVVACEWTYALRKQYESDDFDVFERWVNQYVDNWAACDTLCNHTVGTIVEMYPVHIRRLKEWAVSDNRWMRRAAAVTLIIPARKGLFLFDIFEIASILLTDKDDMVRKGYGWMLKAASEAHQMDVFDFVMQNKAEMPRTALRYAIEKMPEAMRKEAMKK